MEGGKNPYAAPAARLDNAQSEAGAEVVLAGRMRRLAGAIIDGLLLMLFFMPAMFFTGVFDIYEQDQQSLLLDIALSVAGFALWLVLNGYLLYHHAQTIGKRLVGTRIVSLENTQAEMSRIVLYRTLPIHVLSSIPFIGSFVGLIDVLFIFGAERRCLHDYIAGTRVVMA
jgi:uncharacterized RDD family membrane protein YckC